MTPDSMTLVVNINAASDVEVLIVEADCVVFSSMQSASSGSGAPWCAGAQWSWAHAINSCSSGATRRETFILDDCCSRWVRWIGFDQQTHLCSVSMHWSRGIPRAFSRVSWVNSPNVFTTVDGRDAHDVRVVCIYGTCDVWYGVVIMSKHVGR